MKTKLRNLLIIIISFTLLLGINIFASKVEAADINFKYDREYKDGQEFWHFPAGFYCVQKGQHLFDNVPMNIVKNIKIDGKISTVDNEKIELEQNAIMAYIFHQNDGSSSVHWSTTGYEYYSPKQQAIYGYFPTWLEANGIRDFATNSGGMSDNSMVSDGKKYADSINNIKEASITNKTNRDNLTVDMYEHQGTNYMKAGPLSWEFFEGLDKVTVTNQDGNEVNGVLYGTYKGNDFSVSSNPGDSIWSNNEFYVLVPESSNATKINVKADVSTTRSIITADVNFYRGESWYNGTYYVWQNIIKENTDTRQYRDADDDTIEDIELFIDLSGYVWVDKQSSGKQSLTNDLYKTNSHPQQSNYQDTNDVSYNGLTVRLKDTAGNTISETKTSELGKYSEIDGGEYFFQKVPIAKLSQYYVEFEYDGLTYTNVVAHTEQNSGSKAIEGDVARNNFNLTFSSIENGVAKDQNGSISHSNMTYTVNNHVATFDHKEFYAIQSKTSETPYNLYDAYKKVGGSELRFVNLGLYEREMPDIAVVKDVQNAVLTINNYSHVYNYASRFNDDIDYTNGDSFNVGVQFASKRIEASYSRPVYKADANYTNQGEPSRELKTAITYKIKLVNQSTNLAMKVNNIVDYFDNDYTIKAVGTGVDGNGNITGSLSYSTPESYNGDYNKTIIDTSALGNIEHQNSKDLYVQFEMGRQTVVNLLNANTPLNNVTEVTSYSVFDGKGKVYAGVDKDSNPGNTVPGNKDTYEDDTDKAPAFKLELRDDREMTGTVFVDSTSGELMTGQARQGDGIYKEGEDETVSGVTVTLHEVGGAAVADIPVKTDENGNFKITGYIPGEYELVYTWGDDKYNVQNYKAVAIDKSRWDSYANNKEWYKTTDPRQSDAIDDYATRTKIDKEIQGVEKKAETSEGNNLKDYATNKMNSTTQKMSFPLEYDSAVSSSTQDKLVYTAQNLDFGIVERARQALDVNKRVGTLKVILANGQTIIDAQIDENGKLSGQTNNLTYMGPSNTTVPENGLVKIELDNELIEGATLKIGYIVKATNISEKDYVSEEFYTFGEEKGEPVTITPTLYDYMDNTMAVDQDDINGWTEVTIEDFNSRQTDPTIVETNSVRIIHQVNSDGTITTKVVKDGETTETSYSDWKSSLLTKRTEKSYKKSILYNEALYNPIATGQSNTMDLHATKLLANTDEIELNNEVEVTKVEKNGGSEYNYKNSTTHDESETVTVVPSTGEDRSYIIYIAAGTIALIVLATGVVIIRKRALGNK